MSIEGMALAWRGLESLIEGFYEAAREPLREGLGAGGPTHEWLQGMEEEAAGRSSQIRLEAENLLAEPGDGYETATELLLAAAAIDVQLAVDFAVLRPQDDEAPLRARVGGGEQWVAEGEEAIAQASALFEAQIDDGLPSIGGGAPRPRSRKALAGDACDSVEELTDLAEGPAAWLVKGFWSGVAPGIGEILATRDVRHIVDEIRVSHGEIFRRGSKLLREFVRKILELLPEGWLIDEVLEAMNERFGVRPLLSRLSGAEASKAYARGRIEGAEKLTWSATDGLRGDLDKLVDGYRRPMKWTRRSAKVLRLGAVPLGAAAVAATGPPGWLIVPSICILGTGYVGYSLTDRIDSRELHAADRIEGVNRLVARYLPIAP